MIMIKIAMLSEPTMELIAAAIDTKIDPEVTELITDASTPLVRPKIGLWLSLISSFSMVSAVFAPSSILSSTISLNTWLAVS